jgi:hypothetical protein
MSPAVGGSGFRRRWLPAVLLACAGLLACAASAAAQFEIPSRQFHNQTSVPLEGRHRTVECDSCHLNGVYKGTPSTCFDCHWTRRQDDRYRLQLGSQCEQCHRPASWTAVQFQHAAVSGGVQLVGRHAQVACTACHVNNVYRGTARDCVGCHQAQFTRAATPNHVAAGFSTACATCHRASDTSWQQGRFDHSAMSGGFQLVGLHAQTACGTCHVNNTYHGTPRDCVGCHLDAYNRSTSPNHAAAGFGTTCDSCHRAADTSWTQARFYHSFPITSGPHKTTCSTCHPSSASFQTFTCLTCHEHDRPTMDAKHAGRAGYRYDSAACYSCHPNGRP